MPTEVHNSSDRPHQVVPQSVLAPMPPLKILATTVGGCALSVGAAFRLPLKPRLGFHHHRQQPRQ